MNNASDEAYNSIIERRKQNAKKISKHYNMVGKAMRATEKGLQCIVVE